jgi:hypothetical protein
MNLINTATPRHCLCCNKTIKGRSDKKFCDDYCRNNFNNHLKSEAGWPIRGINSILRKNRRILEGIVKPGDTTAKITKSKALEKGFIFNYFTHLYTNKKKLVYYFCYDYGYLFLDTEWLLVVKSKDL